MVLYQRNACKLQEYEAIFRIEAFWKYDQQCRKPKKWGFHFNINKSDARKNKKCKREAGILEREKKSKEQEKEDERVIRGRTFGFPLESLIQIFQGVGCNGGEI